MLIGAYVQVLSERVFLPVVFGADDLATGNGRPGETHRRERTRGELHSAGNYDKSFTTKLTLCSDRKDPAQLLLLFSVSSLHAGSPAYHPAYSVKIEIKPAQLYVTDTDWIRIFDESFHTVAPSYKIA